MSITTFKREIIDTSPRNTSTEIIALLEKGDVRASLVRASFAHIVAMPFNPDELITKINQVCDPRKWRQSDRFHIPDSEAIIHAWQMQTEAKIINISRGGVLVEASGDGSDLLLQNNPKLALKINTPGYTYNIKELPVKLARLNVMSWNEDYKPALMRLAYIFLELAPDALTELDQALQLAEKDGLYADDEHEN